MPTRMRSPSCLAHSCSRVYLRSLGTLAMLSSTCLFHLGGIEGCPHDLGRLALAANLDLDGAADRCQGRLDVGDPDVLVDRRAVRARGDDADGAAVTSGSYGPSVDKYIGIAYVETALASVGSAVEVEIRGQGKAAQVARTPFYPAKVKKAG